MMQFKFVIKPRFDDVSLLEATFRFLPSEVTFRLFIAEAPFPATRCDAIRCRAGARPRQVAATRLAPGVDRCRLRALAVVPLRFRR